MVKHHLLRLSAALPEAPLSLPSCSSSDDTTSCSLLTSPRSDAVLASESARERAESSRVCAVPSSRSPSAEAWALASLISSRSLSTSCPLRRSYSPQHQSVTKCTRQCKNTTTVQHAHDSAKTLRARFQTRVSYLVQLYDRARKQTFQPPNFTPLLLNPGPELGNLLVMSLDLFPLPLSETANLRL
jgi:hypothetical protein